MESSYFPCALNLHKKLCIVIGSDEEAVDKSIRLAQSGASVHVFGRFNKSTTQLLNKNKVKILSRPYKKRDVIKSFYVVYTPKTNPQETKKIVRLCRTNRILLCTIDQPATCDVVNVSVYERGPLRFTISSGGISPALARKIREGLESTLAHVPIEKLMRELANFRKKLEKTVPDISKRRKLLIEAVKNVKFSASLKIPRRTIK